MIRIAIGYVAVVVACALLILVNPVDFMGKTARQERLAAGGAETAPAAPSVAVPSELVAPEQASGSIAASTASILANLSASEGRTTAALETAEEAALRKMSEAVIAGLKGTAAAEPQSLETLVARALAEGQTDKAIDEIVNAAVAEGSITAPEGLTTTDGKVDTAVLLAAIVAEAQGAALGDEFGQGDLSEPTDVIESGTPSMQAATEDVLYVVKPGDSLGAIALRFYGKADLNGAIFKANRQVLDTPQSLRVGMKLLIPARSGLKG